MLRPCAQHQLCHTGSRARTLQGTADKPRQAAVNTAAHPCIAVSQTRTHTSYHSLVCRTTCKHQNWLHNYQMLLTQGASTKGPQRLSYALTPPQSLDHVGTGIRLAYHMLERQTPTPPVTLPVNTPKCIQPGPNNHQQTPHPSTDNALCAPAPFDTAAAARQQRE